MDAFVAIACDEMQQIKLKANCDRAPAPAVGG